MTGLSQVCAYANIMEKAHVQLEICAMFLTAISLPTKARNIIILIECCGGC